MESDAFIALARVAHQLWCESMKARGWNPGDRYDQEEMTHDALVAFDRLDRRDRRAVRIGILAEELAERLVGAIRFSRGPNREFMIEEMRVGRRVVFLADPPPAGGVDAADIGTVESWTVDEDGELDLMAVRWPDGRLLQYAPGFLELARLEELA